MANVKITELTETTTPETNDLIELAISPDEATPLSRSVSVLNLVGNGWIKSNDTWAYASATTITVPSGAASIYSIGDKIKLTQTTVKYFYIVGVADTVLTVTGGSTYTVADAAITLNYYSKAASPVGFPHVFTHTTSWGGFTATVPTGTFSFQIVGKEITVFYVPIIPGVSNATTLTFTLPLAPVGSIAGIPCFVADNSTNQSVLGHIQLTASNTTASVYKTFYQGVFTDSNNKDFYLSSFSYRFA